MKVVIVTGATSGIGYETVTMLAQSGQYTVYGAGRHVEALKPIEPLGVRPLRLDLTDSASITDAVHTVLDQEGRVDVLINNAGYGSLGTIENVSPREARRQMDVNVFGLMELTQQVLPVMRGQSEGLIINVSSIAGRVVSLVAGWYHASKYALEALSDALRREVRPFGIRVVIVEPGAIRTPWADIASSHLEDSSKGTVYEEMAKKSSRFMRRLYGSRWVTPPQRVARTIVKAVEASRPKARYRVGFSSTLQLVGRALLPTSWQDRLYSHL